ncbi:MAG: DUF3298 and DUF4163 domain-containing protein [Lachnospiraceae bacterium]|nr:DUF3298 and DUF4163 domain-containing protein [Lachnospiraceae bacterium]
MRGIKTEIIYGMALILSLSALCGCGGVGDIAGFSPEAVEQYIQEKSEAESAVKNEAEPITQETEAEADTAEASGTDEETVMPELLNTPFDMSVKDEETGSMIYECYGNSFLCSEESGELFPKLAAALEDVDEAEKDSYQYNIDKFGEDAKEFASEQDGKYTYYTYSETELQFADDHVTSMLRTEYGFLGGAHPDYYYVGINIDSQTGEEIMLSDIISDKEDLNRVLKDKLTEQYPDGNFFDLDESLASYDLDGEPTEGENRPYIYTMTPAGLTFYFDPYDLNSYADGSQTVDVFFTDIPELLLEDSVFTYYEDEGRGDLFPYED